MDQRPLSPFAQALTEEERKALESDPVLRQAVFGHEVAMDRATPAIRAVLERLKAEEEKWIAHQIQSLGVPAEQTVALIYIIALRMVPFLIEKAIREGEEAEDQISRREEEAYTD